MYFWNGHRICVTNGRKPRRSDFKYDCDDYLSLEEKKKHFQEDLTSKSKEDPTLNKTGLIFLLLKKIEIQIFKSLIYDNNFGTYLGRW